ncbi:hypothetical protein MTQ28_23985, partial [Escherichia coli]|nr:hypothetical protein [Escherichia coli]
GAIWRLIPERTTVESPTTCERWSRSPQPQRPNVSERVGEEAEVNQSPGWAHTHGFSAGDMR